MKLMCMVRKKGIGNLNKVKRDVVERNRRKAGTMKKIMRYVPIQTVKLSLEETELQKQTDIGVASPIEIDGARIFEGYEKLGVDINSV
jgi:hypothetical protein